MSEAIENYSWGHKCGRRQMIEIAITAVMYVESSLIPEDSAEFAIDKILKLLNEIKENES
jgi:hypothetical protein